MSQLGYKNMSVYSTKKVEQQFSTADLQQNRSYSSRFSKTRNKKHSLNPQSTLPYQQQKSVTLIQKWWRSRMYMRRLFYQRLHEELYYDNQAMQCMVKQQENYLQGILNQIQGLEALNRVQLDQLTRGSRSVMKSLAKDCVGLTFKMEKRMLNEKQLNRLMAQRNQAEERIEQLKVKKLEIETELMTKANQSQQIMLKQIKQANNQLLKLVSQRNALKQKLRQQAIDKNFPCTLP